MSSLTIITPTGERPESLARCAEYVARQTIGGPIQWIVVDDGRVPSEVPAMPDRFDVWVIRPGRKWTPGANTLAPNLLTALAAVNGNVILFFEDDDWYAPNYAEVMAALITDDVVVAGESPSLYYNVARRCWRKLNADRASLCQTALKASAIDALRTVCQESAEFIDVRLWDALRTRSVLTSGTHLCVGMKGLPGRPGIGIGHRPEQSTGWTDDPTGAVLASWIGPDVTRYFPQFSAADELQSPSVQSVPPEQIEDGLEVFYWGGQKRYRCPKTWESGARCEYDTYDKTAMVEHMGTPHTYSGKAPIAPSVPIRRKSPIVDGSGNPFEVDEAAAFKGAKFKV